MLRDLDFDQSLDLHDFIIKELLSIDIHTMVFSAKNQKTNKEVAIKIYQINKQNAIKHYQKMIYINSINFPGIVRLLSFGYYDNDIIQYFNRQNFFPYMDNYLYFVGEFEWMENKTLKHFLSERDQIDPTIISKIIFGIAFTINSIHKSNLIYCDLTPSNILLDKNFEPKLVMSYHSRFLEKDKKKKKNNLFLFYAPEIEEVKLDFSCDAYSFGMILYDIFNKLGLKKDGNMFGYNKPFEQNKTPDKYWKIVDKCIKCNKNLRPTFLEIVEFLKNAEFEENDAKIDLSQLREFILRFEKGEMATITDRFSLLMSKVI